VKVYFDTNVLVAGMLRNHPHYAPAEAMLRRVVRGEVEGCISTHGLAELYAVLTRLPVTPAVYPTEASQMIQRNVLPRFEMVPLSGREYKEAIAVCASAGWAGGRIYDVLHLAAARRAGCDELCTFNVRHFRELGSDWVNEIRLP